MGEASLTKAHPLLGRDLDAERLTQADRIGAAAQALHLARQEQYEAAGRHLFLQSWAAMWPEYQSQLRREAQAIVWAIDAFDRAALESIGGDHG